MSEVKLQGHLTLKSALAQLPVPPGEPYVEPFKHGTLSVGLYAPRSADLQEPHTQDEVYIVMSGTGEFSLAGETEPIGPGDILFAAAGVEHRFLNFTDDLVVWVIFYGPEGGEKTR
jgi:mannose-6-phosphate isomerase-like protein (cupin superfamily)